MAGVPGLGQLLNSVSMSLSGFDNMIGGVGTQVRRRVRSSSMKGVDAGLMCGFGVGYGFGAGLVLKPSALQALQRAVQDLNGRVMAAAKSRVPPQLTQLMKQPGSDTFPLAQQQRLGTAAQAVTSPSVRLGDFSKGRVGGNHSHFPDSSQSANSKLGSAEASSGQELHVRMEQPDLQEFTGALMQLTAGLNDCACSLREATIELKQACAELRKHGNGA
ncbi:hypothetical protein COCSUDRAFT_62418 [Coccomyxa subellipsoidea C-169]|uniref:Uncharacterized protein n=1 Tax=Coccomyxa subellipsoidea (strain C-169) TaxID=574566 RepID=I0YZR9_COCSC|nr:hypothetical protein COCSUDRAFT_62418 [Coccomyxa subellipsoidea C-169]EIE23888.1 hypothetical protein COCSUDRAFT_62418 [Coccomyxa subellipsoidea C-169]|eukprot:XP_005648432.1 hypothetical protein COCSUDRAFT_62418 [Coccomyxa subellipsoidea C-169]